MTIMFWAGRERDGLGWIGLGSRRRKGKAGVVVWLKGTSDSFMRWQGGLKVMLVCAGSRFVVRSVPPLVTMEHEGGSAYWREPKRVKYRLLDDRWRPPGHSARKQKIAKYKYKQGMRE